MSEKPYIYAPDSFWLRLFETPVGLEVRAFESAFGTTDELLCYYRGILIGNMIHQKRGNGLLINLLPKLDPNRKYTWPSTEAFEQALGDLLRDTHSWNLVCERDCDQQPVPELSKLSSDQNELSLVYAYCKGTSSSCPTFSLRENDV